MNKQVKTVAGVICCFIAVFVLSLLAIRLNWDATFVGHSVKFHMKPGYVLEFRDKQGKFLGMQQFPSEEFVIVRAADYDEVKKNWQNSEEGK